MLSEASCISSINTAVLSQREKNISCLPVYSKLKKNLVIKKVGKRNKRTTPVTNPMLMLINLPEKLYLIFIRSKGSLDASVQSKKGSGFSAPGARLGVREPNSFEDSESREHWVCLFLILNRTQGRRHK